MQGPDDAESRRAREQERRRRRAEREQRAEAQRAPQPPPGWGKAPERKPAESAASVPSEPQEAVPPERPKRERPAASGRLSEAWARRIAAVLLVIGAVIVALAIADVGPFSDPPTESERARDTVVGFFAAASQGEWGEFCSRLTTDAREQVQANVSELTGREAKGCVEALSVGGSGSFAGLSLRIKSVRIIGNQGRVEAVVKLPEEPPEPRSILLLQDEGVWLINDPD